MTNQLSNVDALVSLPDDRIELEAVLEQTLDLLRRALKAVRGVVLDRALQTKAVQVAVLAAQVQKCCTMTSGCKQFGALQPSHDVSEDWAIKKQQDAAPQPSVWSGFYNKTLRERFDVLALMYPRLKTLKMQPTSSTDAAAEIMSSSDPTMKLGELPLRTANLMIENCIGVLGIPLG